MNALLFQIDAFTSQPFKGNPAGVVLSEHLPPREMMQNMAMEMNLSETAYIAPTDDGYSIRFFTPTTEIDLCGHATLASAHVLFEKGWVPSDSAITFHSKAGILKVEKQGDWLKMNFPINPVQQDEIPSDFVSIIGTSCLEFYKTEDDWSLAVLPDEETVLKLNPNIPALAESSFPFLIVTALSDDANTTFVCRVFVPKAGIDEDPVTGSAHCALIPLWTAKTGETEMVSRQVSKRGGLLKLENHGERVEISGQAITIFEASLNISLQK